MAEAPTEQTIDIAGPLRTPRNMYQGKDGMAGKGSIHDDATASKLGFKGGTVAGSVHMDQFAPIVLQLFGEDFFANGNISLNFKQATVDAEPVRAFARKVGDGQARLWMERQDGVLVAEGTARLGIDNDSQLAKLLKSQKEGGDLRMLAACKVGDVSDPRTTRVDAEQFATRKAAMTEWLPQFDGKNRWNRPIAPMSSAVGLARAAQGGILKRLDGIVGLFGALEVQYINGPLFADQDYSVVAKTLSLSESPKTENIWWEGVMSDPKTNKPIARHLQYLRFMKGSSPLWEKK